MSNKETKVKLFSEFPPVSTIDWKRKVEKDLNEHPFEKLVWKTLEGFDVQPFYREEDLADKEYLQSLAVLTNTALPNDWEIREDIEVDTIESANSKAFQAMNKGATSIAFIIPDDQKLNKVSFSLLLKGIYIDCIQLHLISHSQAGDIPDLLDHEVRTRGIDPVRINGSIDLDPIGYLSKTGKFLIPEKQEFIQTSEIVKKVSGKFPNLRVIGINTSVFHYAGASIVQELGFGLSVIAEYFLQLTETDIPVRSIAKVMQVNISTGPVYFMEIAKVRALRLLFSRLIESWGVTDEDTLKTFIHSNTSERAQAVCDSFTNILRSATQSMSAVLGGVNSLTVTPFDKAFRKTTPFSERIARNIQVILKEEAFFDKVQDPSSGSYYVESLTDSLVKHSWDLFLKIEDEGGYLKAFKNGIIQKIIKETSSSRDMNIAHRKDIIVGINKYQYPMEKAQDNFDAEIAFPKENPVKNGLAEPLMSYRSSRAFEELRMITGKNIHNVFLLKIGSRTWRKARAEFASEFFACGGFKVIDNPEFDTIDEGIKSAVSVQANIVVLCSSDEEYGLYGPEAFKKLPDSVIFVIAGFPKDIIEKLKAEGIVNYIHVKSNVLYELRKYQELLGI